MRVALLTNIPAPYRLSFFRELSARCELRVFFDSRSEPNRQWAVPDDLGFPHEYLAGFVLRRMRRRPDGGPPDERFIHVRYGILPALNRFRPDVVISIEFGPRSLQAAAYCTMRGVPLVLWSEGTAHSEGWQGRARTFIRRALVRRAAGYWSNGVASSGLLVTYGAPGNRIQDGMIGVDTRHLYADVAAEYQARDRVRAELGLSGVVLLFSGQLVARKGVSEYLAALDGIGDRDGAYSLLFLGDGPQRTDIESWAAAHPGVRVVLLGFRQPAEVPRYYACADAFVLPTLDDNWSLVTLEAAVAGLPQAFSRYNGASEDLIARGAAGRLFDPGNRDGFSSHLRELIDSRPTRSDPAVTAGLVEYYGPAACADRGIHALVECIGRHRGPR